MIQPREIRYDGAIVLLQTYYEETMELDIDKPPLRSQGFETSYITTAKNQGLMDYNMVHRKWRNESRG